MKTLKFLNRFLLLAGTVVVFASCNEKDMEVSEINQNKEICLAISKEEKIRRVEISFGAVIDKIVIDYGYRLFSSTIKLPAGGIYTTYPDSIVVMTANQHKLNIKFRK